MNSVKIFWTFCTLRADISPYLVLYIFLNVCGRLASANTRMPTLLFGHVLMILQYSSLFPVLKDCPMSNLVFPELYHF